MDDRVIELSELAARVVDEAWTELDVREEILTPLLRLLGYRKGSDYDVNREKHLLVHPFLMRGSDRVKLDYALVVRRRDFWVLEAKRPSNAITPASIHQAYFYAIHPEVQARFFAVCNGRTFALFDVREVNEQYRPVLEFALADLGVNMARLQDLIGASRVRDELARRAIGDLRKALEAEIRADRVRDLERELKVLVKDAERAVEDNVRRLYGQRFQEDDAVIRELFGRSSAAQIARVGFELEGINTRHRFDLLYGIFEQRLTNLPPTNLAATLHELGALLGADATSTHRLNVLQALLRYLPKAPTSLAVGLRDRIGTCISDVIHKFPNDERQRLLWRLEGLLKRVPYKVSFTDREVFVGLDAFVTAKRAAQPDEENIKRPPTVWGERSRTSLDQAVKMFRQYRAATTPQLREIVAGFEKLEAEVSDEYIAATRSSYDGEVEPPLFVYFDQPLDQYRSALFSKLNVEFETAVTFIGDQELTGIEALLRNIARDVYHLNHADVFWLRVIRARGRMDALCDPTTLVTLSDEIVSSFLRSAQIQRTTTTPLDAPMLMRGQIDTNRWATYRASLDLDDRRVKISDATLC